MDLNIQKMTNHPPYISQPILKSNSKSFIFNNIFCEMKGKKIIHWGGEGWGNGEQS